MAKMGFHKGWSGSPFHTGYDADNGYEARPTEDEGPSARPGVMQARVRPDLASRPGAARRSGRRADRRDED